MGILLSKIVMFWKSFQSHEHVVDFQKDLQLKDRISELPDDIFVDIISHLPVEEVARNSVVSRRWRNCWKVMTRLEFDSFPKAYERFATRKNMFSYVKWVNRILDSHEGAKLHEFRICYGLFKHFGLDIHKWVRFAFAKQVECFHLEVRDTQYQRGRWKSFVLTTDFVETFVNNNFNGFKYLKALSFQNVNIDDKLLELILKRSPVLERLSINSSRTLSTVRISGPQCVLKSLELTYGPDSLEISDVATLVSFTYRGHLPKKFIFNNVPLLSEFSFSGNIVDALFGLKLNDMLVQFSCSLKTLTLDLSDVKGFENYRKLPQLTALEKLTVQNLGTQNYTEWYAKLTMMCPSLREFVFQCTGGYDDINPPNGRKVNITKNIPHKCLKKVKILGYHGCARDVAIALYFFQNTVALETMVIDPRDQCPFSYRYAPVKGLEQDSRIRAKKQLKGKVPSRVKLVIL